MPGVARHRPPPDRSSAELSLGRQHGAITVSGNVGPPVSLWDVDWPSSGYYWTVIPVVAVGAREAPTVVGSGRGEGRDRRSPSLSTTGFARRRRRLDRRRLRARQRHDHQRRRRHDHAVTAPTNSRTSPASGRPVRRLRSRYVDAELAEDVCAARSAACSGSASRASRRSRARRRRSPRASRRAAGSTSAAHTSTFYGAPLIAWTPAFNADIYEVQYSKTRYPFKPEVDPRSSVKGFMTFSTSDVLPLKTRARGGTACAASTSTCRPACSR